MSRPQHTPRPVGSWQVEIPQPLALIDVFDFVLQTDAKKTIIPHSSYMPGKAYVVIEPGDVWVHNLQCFMIASMGMVPSPQYRGLSLPAIGIMNKVGQRTPILYSLITGEAIDSGNDSILWQDTSELPIFDERIVFAVEAFNTVEVPVAMTVGRTWSNTPLAQLYELLLPYVNDTPYMHAMAYGFVELMTAIGHTVVSSFELGMRKQFKRYPILEMLSSLVAVKLVDLVWSPTTKHYQLSELGKWWVTPL